MFPQRVRNHSILQSLLPVSSTSRTDWENDEPDPVRENGRNQLISLLNEYIVATGQDSGSVEISQQDLCEEFLLAMASALQGYGCPTHTLEFHLEQVARGIGHPALFAVFPNYMLVSFGTSPNGLGGPAVYLPSRGSSLDIFKLQLVDELARRVASYGDKHGGTPARTSFSSPTRDAEIGEQPPVPFVQKSSIIRKVYRALCKFTGFTQLSSHTSIHPFELPATPVTRPRAQSYPPTTAEPEADIRSSILHLAAFGGMVPDTPFPDTREPPPRPVSPFEFESDTELRSQSCVNLRKIVRDSQEKEDERRRVKYTLTKEHRQTLRRIAIDDGVERLHEIIERPPLYSLFVNILLYAIASASCAVVFFDGSWSDFVAAGVLGAGIGVLSAAAAAFPTFAIVHEFVSAFFVAMTARLLVYHNFDVCYAATTFSPIIWLVHGIPLTMAMVELATRNMMSGTARLFYSLTVSGILGFGLDLGVATVAETLHIEKFWPAPCDNPIPYEYQVLLTPVAAVSFCLLSNAHVTQLFPMLLSGFIGFYTNNVALKTFTSSNIAPTLGGFAVGLFGNLWSWLTGHPAVVPNMGGLFMLVPGALAVKGFSSFLNNDATTAIALTISVLHIAVSLAIGVFMASVLVAPFFAAYHQHLKRKVPGLGKAYPNFRRGVHNSSKLNF